MEKELSIAGRQIRLSDIFVITAVLAGFAIQTPRNSWNAGDFVLGLTLFVVWNRPQVFRLWACFMIAYGAGKLVYGLCQFAPENRMYPASWGTGLLAEAITAIYMFSPTRNQTFSDDNGPTT